MTSRISLQETDFTKRNAVSLVFVTSIIAPTASTNSAACDPKTWNWPINRSHIAVSIFAAPKTPATAAVLLSLSAISIADLRDVDMRRRVLRADAISGTIAEATMAAISWFAMSARRSSCRCLAFAAQRPPPTAPATPTVAPTREAAVPGKVHPSGMVMTEPASSPKAKLIKVCGCSASQLLPDAKASAMRNPPFRDDYRSMLLNNSSLAARKADASSMHASDRYTSLRSKLVSNRPNQMTSP